MRRRRPLLAAGLAAAWAAGSAAGWAGTGGIARAAQAATTPAATRTLRPGDSLQQALREAADGDTLALQPGDYRGEVAVITHKRLTLRGLVGASGGRPVLHAAGHSAEGKAILVVRDGDIDIENIEFRGARVRDRNGAGIRFERGRLRVVRCAFFDNQNGILAGNHGDAELSVHDSEFADAPAGTPLPHLVYVGRIARFELSGSRFSGGQDGHLVKSRARVNDVRYNQLVDGAGGRAAYELEFPNGGLAWVVGNVIGQGPGSTNPVMLSFGAEGGDGREQGLFLAHNTFINASARPAWFVRFAGGLMGGPASGPAVPAERRFVNNLYTGLGVSDIAWEDLAQGNFAAPQAVLHDAGQGLYALGAGSLLRGRVAAAGMARGLSLQPGAEFTPPVGTRPLSPPPRWSPGAYQT